MFFFFQQLAALLITRQVIGNIKEALVPYVIDKLKLFKIGYQMTEAMSPDTLERHMKEITGEKGETAKSDRNCDMSRESSPSSPRSDSVRDELLAPPSEKDGLLSDSVFHEGDSSNGGAEIGGSVFKVQHSGPHLTQAEVEAHMKKVSMC